MQSRHVEFENQRGMTIAGILQHPETAAHDDGGQQYPAAILCHSFTGYKEIPHLQAMAARLASNGFVVLRFDFTDCVGGSDGTCRDMTLTNQIKDLHDAFDFLEAQGEVDPDRIGVAGHSLGGMTALQFAAEDDRPRAVVPVAAPARAEGENLFQGKEIDRWQEMSHIHFPTTKEGEVEIGWQFYEDLQQYDGRDAVRDVAAPIRFIHGTEDEIVPISNSEEMYENANDPKDLITIQGGTHLFTNQEHEDRMVQNVADWLEQHVEAS